MTEQLLTLLGISSPFFVLAFIVMWWLLKRSVDAKIDVIKSKEIDAFKNDLAKELETIKHELTLEHAKQSIVYENQRDSFRSLIQGMYKAIEDLRQPFDELWTSIRDKYYGEFRQLVAEEALFIGSEGKRALDIFRGIYASTISWDPMEDLQDEGLRRAYEQMCFISERIGEHFRNRIGLPGEKDPLLDVFILDACIILNRYNFKEIGLPTQGIFKIVKDQSPLELIKIANEHSTEFIRELEMLAKYLESTPDRRSTWYELFDQVKWYLNRFVSAQKVIL